ncbi:hypothetical protein HK096_002723 [Nowakowskiella sp. JEL0078]|nr:hypothetical protein HK096_002723 [Nowakowskiella sp. JEL0078]
MVEQLGRKEVIECPVCLEETGKQNEGVILPCLHVVCKECIEGVLLSGKNGAKCPVCRMSFNEVELLSIMNAGVEKTRSEKEEEILIDDNENFEAPSNTVQLRSIKFRSSTKLDAMIEILNDIRSQKNNQKIVIFSQWTSMLDIVEISLKDHGYLFLRLDGTLSQKSREKVLRSFQNDKKYNVLIASLRSSGVGINITAANNVIMLDLWWNEAVENQAIDRVHRIGKKIHWQTKEVKVWKLVVAGSVEERMLSIQRMKTHVAGAAMGDSNGLKMDEIMSLLQ